MKRHVPSLWNLSEIDEGLHKTNNALERHNRRLNNKISAAQPSFAQFAAVLPGEEWYYSSQARKMRS